MGTPGERARGALTRRAAPPARPPAAGAAAPRGATAGTCVGLARPRGHGLPRLLDDLDGVQAGQRHQQPRRRPGSRATRRSRTSATRSTARTSGTPSKNSLIIVSVTVALSMVLAFLAAVALAKFRFTGRELFIVLIIGIQMLPPVGLIIPLYIVLAQLPPDERTLTGVIAHVHDVRAAVRVWTLRGFILGDPEGARGGGDGRRLEPARRVRQDPAAARRARASWPRRSSRSSPTWNEYIFANVLLQDQSKQTLTVWLSYFNGTAATPTGAALMAASTLTAIPVVDLLPARPAEDRVRADGRRREGLSAGPRAARARPASCPGFPGLEPPDWVRRRLAERPRRRRASSPGTSATSSRSRR